jgi:hypothetical protein
MTAPERRVRLALRLQSRSYACAPEVCPHGGPGVRESALATRPTRLHRLDRTLVVLPRAALPATLTIQRHSHPPCPPQTPAAWSKRLYQKCPGGSYLGHDAGVCAPGHSR